MCVCSFPVFSNHFSRARLSSALRCSNWTRLESESSPLPLRAKPCLARNLTLDKITLNISRAFRFSSRWALLSCSPISTVVWGKVMTASSASRWVLECMCFFIPVVASFQLQKPLVTCIVKSLTKKQVTVKLVHSNPEHTGQYDLQMQ